MSPRLILARLRDYWRRIPSPESLGALKADVGPSGRRYLAENGAGLAGSLLMHGLALLLILLCIRTVSHAPQPNVRAVLVDIVRLGEKTMSPPAPQKSAMPQQQAAARRETVAHSPDVTVAPRQKKPPPDDLQNRLNALSKLRAPETDPRLLQDLGNSSATSTSNDAAAGDQATYSLRDYVRAQVERRWNLDLGLLGTRTVTVALNVVMKGDGRILVAEVVDRHRYATDAVYRQIAMSARNAVLLSSPIALPAGNYPATTEMTLNLNPRDAMR